MIHTELGPAPARGRSDHPYYLVCAARGFCGPFVNQMYYDSLTVWSGFGDCVECGCTVPIPRNGRGLESLGSFVEAILPPAAHWPLPRVVPSPEESR